MTQERPAGPPEFVAALEHLTGRSRGSVAWLREAETELALGPDGRLVPSPPGAGCARFVREGESYRIEAQGDAELWVNGALTGSRALAHGDMIEFGARGPLSRFRLYGEGHRVRRSVEDIFGDCVAYLRASRRPLPQRIPRAAGDLFRRLARETSVLFRGAVVAALLALAAVIVMQQRTTHRLEERLAHDAARIEGLQSALSAARSEALTPADLAALRADLAERLSSNVARLEELERRSAAGPRVFAEAAPAVAFLQGAYGVREIASGRMLRHVVGRDGMPVMLPNGRPMLSLEGEGPTAEIQYTGTGFLVADPPVLVTNRHVARPWETGTDAAALAAQGLEPAPLRRVAWFPGAAEPVPVDVARTSELADLAVLSLPAPPPGVRGLRLAGRAPATGDEVLVMGYPTGMRSMLAQSGEAFVEELQKAGETGFWKVAERLARAGLISPMASRGIVARSGAEAVMYDAETTHGGSGGPVLNLRGEVVAVNTAILPEFGGANFGTPAEAVRRLLAAE